jgi:hypothetical protein
MRSLAGRSAVITAAALTAVAGSATASALAAPATAAKAAVKWTKISTNTSLGIASAGLLRTADGRLHVVWPKNDGSSRFSLHYSTIGAKSKLLNTGVVVGKWTGISTYPRLLPGPNGGIRLIFTGGNGVGGSPLNTGAMYVAQAGQAGTTWKLVVGSMSQSTLVPLTDTSASAEASGTPVAAWPAGPNLDFHVSIDPKTPATSADSSVPLGKGAAVVGSAMARDKSGAIWAAWFNESGLASQGYYVKRLIPTAGIVRAPSSGGKNFANNQPLEAVALTARAGGGVYLAYCVPSKTIECTHVALWKAGAKKALSVPGSATGHASHVAIAAAPGGHLWLAWFDESANKIRVVETNASATKFGSVRTISAPAGFGLLYGLQAEASQGTLDLVALVLGSGAHSTPSWWDAQLK